MPGQACGCLLHTCQATFAFEHGSHDLFPAPGGAYGVGGACAWSGAPHAPSCPRLPSSWVGGGPRPCPPLACTADCLGPSLFLLPAQPSRDIVLCCDGGMAAVSCPGITQAHQTQREAEPNTTCT